MGSFLGYLFILFHINSLGVPHSSNPFLLQGANLKNDPTPLSPKRKQTNKKVETMEAPQKKLKLRDSNMV